jgi:hypothetical protein
MARAAGMTLRAIGQRFGLSPPRIRQILRNEGHKAACLERHAAIVALAAAGDHEAVLASPSTALFFRRLSTNTRIQEALHYERLDTIAKIAATTPAELLRCPTFGRRLLATLIAVLADVGVALQGPAQDPARGAELGYAVPLNIDCGPEWNGDRTLDVLEPGVIVLHGPPVSGKVSLVLQALLSAANKGFAVGYISGAHPSFVTRQLEAMLTHLGLTSRNLYLFPEAPREAIEAERLKKLIEDCSLNILCIDDYHLATKAEVRTAETISRETGCRVLIVTRPSQAKPPPICQLPDLAPLPSAKRRRYGKALKEPRGSRPP